MWFPPTHNIYLFENGSLVTKYFLKVNVFFLYVWKWQTCSLMAQEDCLRKILWEIFGEAKGHMLHLLGLNNLKVPSNLVLSSQVDWYFLQPMSQPWVSNQECPGTVLSYQCCHLLDCWATLSFWPKAIKGEQADKWGEAVTAATIFICWVANSSSGKWVDGSKREEELWQKFMTIRDRKFSLWTFASWWGDSGGCSPNHNFSKV